jgi:Carboxypeptidase regulatory-like domain
VTAARTRVLLVALAGLAAACAGSDDKPAAEPVCRGLPKLEEGDPQPAKPKPVSLDGVVDEYETEFWDAGETDSAGGLCVVSKTAKGTFALSGIVKGTQGRPVSGARVALEALGPAGPNVRADTVTDVDGAFAFVDMPAQGTASCYRTSIQAKALGSYVLISDDIGPGQTYEQTIELQQEPQKYSDYRDPRACGPKR